MDLFLDIETLGVKKGAQIVAIAAVCGERRFERLIDLKSTGEIELDTVLWWIRDVNKIAINQVFKNENRVSLPDALRDFMDFIVETGADEFWGCSPDFDFGHLEYWCERFSISVPWQFWQLRDVRTVRNCLPKNVVNYIESKFPAYKKHDPMEDCLREQAIVLVAKKMIDTMCNVTPLSNYMAEVIEEQNND